MVNKSRVFISYSRADTRVTNALSKDLQAAGVEIWMDREGIAVGERWSAAIQQALVDSYAMVLVLSPDSMASQNVEDEFTYFLDNKKPIVPVMVRECRLHFQLNRLQWVDFTRGDREKSYEQLLRALYAVGVEFNQQASAIDRAEHSIIAQLLNEIDTEKKTNYRRRRITAGLVAALAVALLVIIGILALGISPFAGDPTATPRPFITAQVDGPDVALYEQPSRDARVLLAALPSGATVIVRQTTPDERFVLVEFGLNRGFVLARDLAFNGVLREIAVYVSPTPIPTATATPFIAPTATVTPSPTPEQVLNPNAEACILTLAADAPSQPALLGPSAVRFTALDSVKAGESFTATARAGDDWLYIGIGWVDRAGEGININSPWRCNNLPDDPNLLPNRVRPFLRSLSLVRETEPRSQIDTSRLSGDVLLMAEVWNQYGGLLANLSELLSIDAGLLAAVIVDEAHSDASQPLPVRFEADLFFGFLPKEQQIDFEGFFLIDPNDPTQHQFRTEKGDAFMDYHGDPVLEWQAFELAATIDRAAAIRALRFGELGVLGDYFAQAGYITPEEMFNAYLESQDARVIGKLDYIKNNTLALGALRFQNWSRFGEVYGARSGAQLAAQAELYYAAFLRLDQ